MSIPELLATYSNPPTNYTGTALFLGYILAALISSGALVLSLRCAYTRLPPTTANRGARRSARAFSLRALVSFAALSVNMLHVLVRSYRAMYRGEDPARGAAELGGRVWAWMLGSGLFVGFARDLVVDAGAAGAAQIALLWTWKVAMAVGREGRVCAVGPYAAYVTVLQILPSSFVLNLLCVGMVLKAGVKAGEKKSDERRAPSRESLRMTVYMVCYVAALTLLPTAGSGGYLVASIFFLRLLLLTSVIFPDEVPHKRVARIADHAGFAFLIRLVLKHGDIGIAKIVTGGLRNPAVRALWLDLIVQWFSEMYIEKSLPIRLDMRGFVSGPSPRA